MKTYRFAKRALIGGVGCILGTACFGSMAVILPLMDLTVPTHTRHGHPSRWSLAQENFRIFTRFTKDCAIAIFSFDRRDQLNSLIR